MAKSFDLIVIGAGPGGYVAAIRAAQLGLKVACIEREHLGGICLNWGCIPTKAMLRSSEVFHLMHRAKEFGLKCDGIDYDLDAVVKRSRGVAKQLSGGIGHLFKKNKITTIMGEAKLAGKGKVSVKTDKGTEELAAKNIVLATGARARNLPGLEADGERVWNYKHALQPPHMPKKLLVIGSGAIGIEFASFYNTLGAETTVVEVMDRILPVEDEEISAFAKKQFEKQGMKILQKAIVKALDRGGQGDRHHRERRQGRDARVRHRDLRRGHRRQRRGAGAGGAGREDRPQPRGDGRILPHRGRGALCHRRHRGRALARAQGQPRGRHGGRADRGARTTCIRSGPTASRAAPTATRRSRASA